MFPIARRIVLLAHLPPTVRAEKSHLGTWHLVQAIAELAKQGENGPHRPRTQRVFVDLRVLIGEAMREKRVTARRRSIDHGYICHRSLARRKGGAQSNIIHPAKQLCRSRA